MVIWQGVQAFRIPKESILDLCIYEASRRGIPCPVGNAIPVNKALEVRASLPTVWE